MVLTVATASFIFTFLIALVASIFFYRHAIWSLVDIIYYQLAAIDILLLFMNNAAQSQLFELGKSADIHRAALPPLSSTKPKVEGMTPTQLTDSSFHLIEQIDELARVCNANLLDPPCRVAMKLQPYVQNFVQVSQDSYETVELWLSKACHAAEQFLNDIRANEVISVLVSDELIAQYQTAISKNYTWLSYDAVSMEAQDFQKRARDELESLGKALSNDDAESKRFVLDTHERETQVGATILLGFYPCIVAPRPGLELLTKWTESRASEEEKLAQIEEDRRRILTLPP